MPPPEVTMEDNNQSSLEGAFNDIVELLEAEKEKKLGRGS
jgi:hypothetical protein